MKIQNGFISNSSSCSFVINKGNLSEIQMVLIQRYKETAKLINMEQDDTPWDITETDTTISGTTHMDNFDMKHLLRFIGVDEADIEWEHGHW